MNLTKHVMSQTIAAIYGSHEHRNKPYFSNRLGASQIGGDCERALWYGFRWAAKEPIEGRILRLFRTGHKHEDEMIDDLRAAGVTVLSRDPETGQQFEYTACNGHFVCNPDGVAVGIKEAPKTPHTLEIKTMNAKNFAKWKKEGVQVSHPKYYAQTQVEMHLGGYDRTFFMVENKDTSEIDAERVNLDMPAAIGLIAKAQRVIDADKPPMRIGKDSSFFKCKFCEFSKVCHSKQPPLVNCRTCAHSTPIDGGKWQCNRHGHEISYDEQLTGCDEHVYNPFILDWLDVTDAGQDWVEYGEFRNGRDHVTSKEMERS